MRKLTIDSSVIIASLLKNEPRHDEALQTWNACGVRGMDALVIQVAQEFEAELITFDDEMMNKYKSFLK